MPDLKSVQEALDALDDWFKRMSRPKQMEFLGHLNSISLPLEAMKRELLKNA